MNQLDIMTFGSVVLNHSWCLCFECASLELIFVDNIHDLLFGTNEGLSCAVIFSVCLHTVVSDKWHSPCCMCPCGFLIHQD